MPISTEISTGKNPLNSRSREGWHELLLERANLTNQVRAAESRSESNYRREPGSCAR